MPFPSQTEQSAMWQALHDSLVLTSDDHEKLRRERGFSDELIRLAAFRTSHAPNREVIAKLGSLFDKEQLAQVGIFYRHDDGEFEPSRMFCGYGATGKWKLDPKTGEPERDKEGKKIREMRYGINPVLIPYLDEGGRVYAMRPHKDFIRRPREIDELDEDYTGQEVYCPHLLRMIAASPLYDPEKHGKFCVITEGEFKGAALIQCGIPALAEPGIQSVGNDAFRRKLVAMLRQFGVNEIVICFDNEVKDDPALPNYKKDEWDRVDSIVWARHTARTLAKNGFYNVRIASLPDEWRVKGKADWDGALRGFVQKNNGDAVKGTAEARREFLKVLKKAKPEDDCLGLFASAIERIVDQKLATLGRDWRCPVGSNRELTLGRRIRKLQFVTSSEGEHEFPRARDLGQAFFDVIGVHFERKLLKLSDEERALYAAQSAAHAGKKEWDKHAYYRELLEGIPTPIANFQTKCLYRLISFDQKLEYLLRVKTTNHERPEQLFRVNADALCKRTEFHRFAIKTFAGAWEGDERITQALLSDYQAQSAHREIHEIPTYGQSDYCKLWKFADRAFTEDGRTILPDKNLVFWHHGIGYQTDFDPSKPGDGFKQGAPTLGEFSIADACESFLLMARHFFDAVGDYDGWLAIGAILAYAAHPEILQSFNGAPGLWFTGRARSGKSTLAEWLIRVWGFSGQGKFALTRESTNKGIARELAKYPSMPAWIDEFSNQTELTILDVIKNSFQRISGVKASFNSSLQTWSITPATTPFVTGVSSPTDTQLRSRFTNISVLDTRSKGDAKKRLREMNAGADKFRNIGHFLMLNRKAFSESVLAKLDAWTSDKTVAKFVSNMRLCFVSGTPFCAVMTLAEMLYAQAPEQYKADLDDVIQRAENFKAFTLQHASESDEETMHASYVNEFWRDVLSVMEIGRETNFGKFFALQWAELTDDRRIHALYEHEQVGLSPVLFMMPDPVYMIYAQEIRKTDSRPHLSMRDLKSELRREDYWLLQGDKPFRIQVRGTDRQACWAFDLVGHPYGAEFLDAMKAEMQHRRNA